MKTYHLHNRPNRELEDKEAINALLLRGKYASIAMCLDQEPYIVSLSYGYDHHQNCLFFHCASAGLKLDFIKANNRVCATVVDDRGYLKGQCAHAYASIVMWGKMTIVENLDEKRHGMQVLLRHLEDDENKNKERLLKSEQIYDKMFILKLSIDQLYAKAGQ